MSKKLKTEEELVFLKEYEELCKKHNLCIGACGCCNSPFVQDAKEEKELTDNVEHLKKVSSQMEY